MSDSHILINNCNKDLLKIALTHPSYTKENNLPNSKSYERLEFFGDAVLKLCTSEILLKTFPDYNEGRLTKIRSILISDSTLAEIAKNIELDKLLILGKGEEQTGGRTRASNLACTLEAILGACYLSENQPAVFEFLNTYICPYIKDIDEHFEKYNAKEFLQEHTQSLNNETPIYKTLKIDGPAHSPIFTEAVFYNGNQISSGTGKTKKEAQQNCAYEACVKLGLIKD